MLHSRADELEVEGTTLKDVEDILDSIALGGKLTPVGLALRYVRDLTEADVAAVASAANPSALPTIARLRERHHALARMIAQGAKHRVAALAMGYAESYVSRLLHEDPAFRELVDYYEKQAEGQWLGVVERMGTLGVTAMQNLQRRLEDDEDLMDAGLPPRMTTREVREILDSAMDRSLLPSKAKGGSAVGGGPSSAPVHVNITFPGGEHTTVQTIELEANRET